MLKVVAGLNEREMPGGKHVRLDALRLLKASVERRIIPHASVRELLGHVGSRICDVDMEVRVKAWEVLKHLLRSQESLSKEDTASVFEFVEAGVKELDFPLPESMQTTLDEVGKLGKFPKSLQELIDNGGHPLEEPDVDSE